LLQAVSSGDGTAKGRPAALKAWGADNGGGDSSRSRFRDGNVVTSRGEKYIVEKVRAIFKEFQDLLLLQCHRNSAGRLLRLTTHGGVSCVQGEEWDGGSRGKVYTKGKRGKGFA
jgi:hypothetical protein